MEEEFSGYQPLEPSVQGRINKAWADYRKAVGFEGDVCHQWRFESGKNAEKAITDFRTQREPYLEIWENDWLNPNHG
jgi:hypothetical protein